MSEAKHRATKKTGLKILTPKQMLQRLPIALAQVRAGNNSQGLLNEIKQIFYYLYQSKKITKKVYNNIINSIQWNYKNGYYIYEFSKTSKPHVLIPKLYYKLDRRIG